MPRWRARAGAAATTRRDPALHRTREQRRAARSASEQRQQVEVGGVEDRDDGDREQVVDDGEGEQEGAQRRGQVRADHREHGQREGDVGGGRYRPAAQASPPARQVDRDVDQRRAAPCRRGGRDRQRRPARVAQVAGDELALEFQADHEEEDRQQAVRRPCARVRSRCSARRADGSSRRARCTTSRPRASSPRPARARRRSSSSAPPTVSVRSTSARCRACGQDERENSRTLGGRCSDGGVRRSCAGSPRESGRQESTRRPDFPAHLHRPYPASRRAARAGPIGRHLIGFRPFPRCRRCRMGVCRVGHPDAHRTAENT